MLLHIRLQITIVLLFLLSTLNAQYDGGDNPRLVVGIVVEQMRADYIARFWDKFGQGGFRRLIGEGTYCRNASYGHFYTQTAVGHASIYTGTMPSSHGIVADQWLDRVSGRWVDNAVFDPTKRTVGGSYDAGRFSPHRLLSTTIGDQIKASNFRQSKVFGISLDPVSAVLSAGHAADGAFWYDAETGNWVTSSYYMQLLPEWLIANNGKKHADIYLTQTWNTSFPIIEYVNSMTDANPYELGISGRFVFPYSLPEIGRGMSIVNRYNLLRQTPFGNTLTKDMAIATIANENLGKGNFTDMLTISFVATQHIGNAFGSLSIEVEDAFIKLDKDIEHFLKFIDDFVGKENVLIFLTSNHGVATTPAYLSDINIPVGDFNSNSAISLLRSYLNAIYGANDWITAHHGLQIYLNSLLIEQSKLDLYEFRDMVAEFMVQFTGVAHVVTATSLHNSSVSDGFRLQLQNSYHPRRSGDVFLRLLPGWVERSNFVSGHNSGYMYDTHVPLIWYGWKVKPSVIVRAIDITDVAPTIATMLNIASPNAAVGNPIEEIIK
jgi:predicted AlkP superfamily pyrophosphatase or phosphodiesterase